MEVCVFSFCTFVFKQYMYLARHHVLFGVFLLLLRPALCRGYHAGVRGEVLQEHQQLISHPYRELNGETRRLSIYLAESLRLQSSIQGSGKQIATFKEGFLTSEEIVADQVTNSIELYVRIRAFFNIVALVTIQDPDYFTYQDAIFVDDKLTNLIQYTKDGLRPPLVFFTSACTTRYQSVDPWPRLVAACLKHVASNFVIYVYNYAYTDGQHLHRRA